MGINLKAWRNEFKFTIILMEQLPFFVATAIAYKFFPGTFDWAYWLLIFAAMIVFEMGAVLMNDHFDFKSGNDAANMAKSKFAGGSDILVNNVIKPVNFFYVGLVFFAFTILVGMFIVFTRSPFVLVPGIIGLCVGLFYSMPPIKFAYRGFGEFMTTIANPLILFGVVFTMGNITTLEQITQNAYPFIVTAVFAFIVSFINASMHIYVEIPDYPPDKATSKNNLVVKLGVKNAGLLYLSTCLIAYAGIIVGILAGYVPVGAIIALPFAFMLTMSAFGGVMEKGNEPAVLPLFIKDAGSAYIITCVALFAVMM